MSVINQMLKDLEQRRAQGFDNNAEMLDDLDVGAASGPPANGRSNVWRVFVVFLLVAIIATWVYLNATSKQDEDVVEVKPAEATEPKISDYKSIVQEVVVEDKQPSQLITETTVLKGIDKTTEEIKNNIEPVEEEVKITSVAVDAEPLKESVSKASNSEIKISAILPSPLLATGEREIITVYGAGFIAPLNITMEWDAGRAFKELEPWQVKVNSETEIQLHINLGSVEDEWRLLIKQVDGSEQAEYKFSVLDMPVKETEPEVMLDKEKTSEKKNEVSFTKVNRTLTIDEKVNLAYSKAQFLIQQGKIKQAKESLYEVLALDFSHLQARQSLSAILFREQAYDEAIEVLKLSSIQHPEHVPFTLLLARIYTERGQDPLAVDLLERLQPAVAPNSEYYALLAALYQRSAQYKNAADVYKKLLVNFPSHAVWWMGLGLSLQSLQQNQNALDAYKRSLQTQGLSNELRRFVKTRITQLTG